MQHTFNLNYTSPTGTTTATVSLTGDENFEANLPVAGGAVWTPFSVTCTKVTMQSILLEFVANAGPGITKTATIKTNSSGSPQDTLILVDSQPVVWYNGGPYSNPFASNVTQFYISDNTTNAVGGTVIVKSLNNQ